MKQVTTKHNSADPASIGRKLLEVGVFWMKKVLDDFENREKYLCLLS